MNYIQFKQSAVLNCDDKDLSVKGGELYKLSGPIVLYEGEDVADLYLKKGVVRGISIHLFDHLGFPEIRVEKRIVEIKMDLTLNDEENSD